MSFMSLWFSIPVFACYTLFMQKLLIHKETLPVRCEICHLSDCFDPVTNHCTRCIDIVKQQEKNIVMRSFGNDASSYSFARKILRLTITISTILLTCLGALFGIIINNGLFGFLRLSLIFAIIGAFLGFVFGSFLAVLAVNFNIKGLKRRNRDDQLFRINST